MIDDTATRCSSSGLRTLLQIEQHLTLALLGNVAATLLILPATQVLAPSFGQQRATQIALGLYLTYNVTATIR